MLLDKKGNPITKQGRVIAVFVDSMIICTECYRSRDPKFEEIAEDICLSEGEIERAPKFLRSLLYYCDVCRKVFARPSKEEEGESSESSTQILSREDTHRLLVEFIRGNKKALPEERT